MIPQITLKRNFSTYISYLIVFIFFPIEFGTAFKAREDKLTKFTEIQSE